MKKMLMTLAIVGLFAMSRLQANCNQLDGCTNQIVNVVCKSSTGSQTFQYTALFSNNGAGKQVTTNNGNCPTCGHSMYEHDNDANNMPVGEYQSVVNPAKPNC